MPFTLNDPLLSLPVDWCSNVNNEPICGAAKPGDEFYRFDWSLLTAQGIEIAGTKRNTTLIAIRYRINGTEKFLTMFAEFTQDEFGKIIQGLIDKTAPPKDTKLN